MIDTVTEWKGKNIETLSREELIEALRFAVKEINRQTESRKIEREMNMLRTQLKASRNMERL